MLAVMLTKALKEEDGGKVGLWHISLLFSPDKSIDHHSFNILFTWPTCYCIISLEPV